MSSVSSSTTSTTSCSNISLYIPIISNSTSEEYIKKMFANANIGKIMRVDFVKNKVKERNEAFIHFEKWFDTDESKNLKEDILNPDTKTRFKYNNSNKFWPLLVNKNAERRNNNPNYEILDSSQVKAEYKKNLSININIKKPTEKANSNVQKKSKSNE